MSFSRSVFSLSILVILFMLTTAACEKNEPQNVSKTDEEQSFVSDCTEQSEIVNRTEQNESVIDSEELKDSFVHNEAVYERLSGNVYKVSYSNHVRLWNAQNKLGNFSGGTYQDIQKLTGQRFLAVNKYSGAIVLYFLDENAVIKNSIEGVDSYEKKDDHVLIVRTDGSTAEKHVYAVTSDGNILDELYWERLSSNVPNGYDCNYLGLRDNELYEITLENDKATEKKILPLSETKVTENNVEIVLREYEMLLEEDNYFCGGYWIYLNGKTVAEYYGDSQIHSYIEEKPIITNGYVLAKQPTGTTLACPLNESGQITTFMNISFNADSEYMIAEDWGLLPDPFLIIDKNGSTVYRENIKDETDANGNRLVYEFESIVFDTESDNPNAIVITEWNGKTIKTTIEDLIG